MFLCHSGRSATEPGTMLLLTDHLWRIGSCFWIDISLCSDLFVVILYPAVYLATVALVFYRLSVYYWWWWYCCCCCCCCCQSADPDNIQQQQHCNSCHLHQYSQHGLASSPSWSTQPFSVPYQSSQCAVNVNRPLNGLCGVLVQVAAVFISEICLQWCSSICRFLQFLSFISFYPVHLTLWVLCFYFILLVCC